MQARKREARNNYFNIPVDGIEIHKHGPKLDGIVC